MDVKLFDTTLRDGAQTDGISFSVEDKIKIAKLLDDIGIHYIEGGWPLSNPKDIEFFQKMKSIKLKNAKLVAFGSTARPNIPVEMDTNLLALLDAETKVVAIFGKTWDFHVKNALKITLEENLKLIEQSVRFLKSKKREVIFDAEHFFDGYKNNKSYAIACIKAAVKGGADVVALCDTNGGSLAFEVQKIVKEVKKKVKVTLGVHMHNDSECAVSASCMAVYCGATHVQGTVNGYGERCGNANLCSIIPILKLKLGINCISSSNLKKLTEVSRHVSEIANLPQSGRQSFVGRSAFSHKAGIHVNAILKHPATYEHIEPALVGNERHLPVSELSGVSTLIYKAKEFGVDLSHDKEKAKEILSMLKDMEHQGYQYEEGDASFELFVRKALGLYKPFFKLEGFRTMSDTKESGKTTIEASIKIKVGEKVIHETAEGDGPVNALDSALRKALNDIYPAIKNIKLTDYKVRVLDSADGTAAKVRVIIESSDEEKSWGTVGVSTNIIEASWLALVDSIEYKLMSESEK